MSNSRTLHPSLEKIAQKDGIFYPTSIDELKTLVQYGLKNNIKIRTIGSSHSPQAAIYDAANKNQIKLILDGDFKKIKTIQPDENKESALVKVGAGCTLGKNPADKSSTWENSFNYQINQSGFALPNLGGISHQTIAGFLQTSSSGGSAKYSIADVVEEIEWINGKGEVCLAKKGDKEFNAAVVSMGLFGIITHVTFKLPKKYLVEGLEVNREFKDSVLIKDEKGHRSKLYNALFKDNDYAHINWLPQKYVGRTMQWTGKAVNSTLPIKAYEHPLRSKFLTFLATIALSIGNLVDKYGKNSDLLLRIKAQLLKLFSDPKDSQEFRDIWYKTLPIDDQADVDGSIKTSFSELWFPHDRIDEVMEKLDKLFAAHPEAAGNFIVELYSAKESPYWLSPSYGHAALRVDLYWWDRNLGDANQYFGLFWDTLLSIPGARFHWGKFLPIPGEQYGEKTFSAKQLFSGNQYPKMAEWLALREEMDPQQLFVTDYWRRVLEIPKTLKKTNEVEEKYHVAESQDYLPVRVLKYFGFYSTEKHGNSVHKLEEKEQPQKNFVMTKNS